MFFCGSNFSANCADNKNSPQFQIYELEQDKINATSENSKLEDPQMTQLLNLILPGSKQLAHLN